MLQEEALKIKESLNDSHWTVLLPPISNNRLVESEHPLRPESASSNKRSNMSQTTGFLENLRWKNKNRPVIAQLNINPLRNKFGFLSSQITKYVDILLL